VNFQPTEEQTLVREAIRQFAEERLRPTARARDKAQKPPLDEIRELGSSG
jgi:alkylation response protein AidB-like acyl-CoA dehydrogenase